MGFRAGLHAVEKKYFVVCAGNRIAIPRVPCFRSSFCESTMLAVYHPKIPSCIDPLDWLPKEL